jgi:phospholipid/cholesterol/gamma-HCH transport system ATP-binding protein
MLRYRAVTMRFGDQLVLEGLDLELPLTGITFVLGPSGAGKSVLAQLAVGLLQPTAGRITLGDAASRGARAPSAALSYVAQGPALLDWLTLRENVAVGPERVLRLGRRDSLARADAVLAELQLEDVAHRLPPEVGPGTQKRISVGRALACRPEALIYDEPTTGLDPRSARELDDLMRAAANRGTAAVVVSHDLVSALRIADRAVVLHQGRVGFDGTPQALLESTAPAVRALLEGSAHG